MIIMSKAEREALNRQFAITYCNDRLLSAYELLDDGFEKEALQNFKIAAWTIKDYPDIVNEFYIMVLTKCPVLLPAIKDIFES